jgi:hypothetical protein
MTGGTFDVPRIGLRDKSFGSLKGGGTRVLSLSTANSSFATLAAPASDGGLLALSGR